jgi:hypothetical protein
MPPEAMHARTAERRIAASSPRRKAVKGVASLVDPWCAAGPACLRIEVTPRASKNCEDSHLAVAFRPGWQRRERKSRKRLDQVKAQGWTPIAYSLDPGPPGTFRRTRRRARHRARKRRQGDVQGRSGRLTPVALGAKGIVIHNRRLRRRQRREDAARGHRARERGKVLRRRPTRPSSARRSRPPSRRAGKKPATTPTSTRPGKLRSTEAMFLGRASRPRFAERQGGAAAWTPRTWRSRFRRAVYEVGFGPKQLGRESR